VTDSTVRLVGKNGQTVTLLDTAEQLMREPGGSGWGLAPVANSWFEGAGDGARLRGTRRLQRELDIPVSAFGGSRADVEAQLRRLVQSVRDPLTIFVDYADGRSYSIAAVYDSGGSGQYGASPERRAQMPLVFKCPDPFWTSVQFQTLEVRPASSGPFLAPLVALPVSSSVAQGLVAVTNVGDVPSRPTWTVHGPGSGLKLLSGSATGPGLVLTKTFTNTDVVTVQYVDGGWTIKDQAGANLYASLGPSPLFPEFPPGVSQVYVEFSGATAETFIRATYPERREVVY
jgi:hypothetical protein